MALTKVLTGCIKADSVDNTILKLDDNFAFTGTVTGTNGKLLQSVNAVTTTATSTITASGQHSVLTANITPSSSSSKIFITAQASCQVVSSSNAIIASDIYRGDVSSGTQISRNYDGPTGTSNSVDHYWTAHHAVVDSPSTTSEITYTFSIGRGSGGTTSIKTVGSAAHPVVMSVMEIG